MSDEVSYSTLQFAWGGLIVTRLGDGIYADTHLVRRMATAGTPGPTLCGIDRFDRTNPGVPGWSVGGGVSGPGIPVTACAGCAAARDMALPVVGLNHEVFAAIPPDTRSQEGTDR